MMKKQSSKRTKAPKAAVKDLAPRKSGQVKAGRMEAQLNSRSVNPIVISRDRALNS